MKSKDKSAQEFVFASPFTLKDLTSRLRRLAQKQHWKIDLEPIYTEGYSFRVSLRHWLPLSISGTLQHDGDNTIVTGKLDTNWMLLIIMVITVLGMGVYQWSTALQPFNSIWQISQSSNPYALETWIVLAFNVGLIFAQVAIAIAVYIGVRRLFAQHKRMTEILQSTLSDAITDLPAADMFSTDDGELMPIKEMLYSNEESARQKR